MTTYRKEQPRSVSTAKEKDEINVAIDVILESISHNEETSICTKRLCAVTKMYGNIAYCFKLTYMYMSLVFVQSVSVSSGSAYEK